MLRLLVFALILSLVPADPTAWAQTQITSRKASTPSSARKKTTAAKKTATRSRKKKTATSKKKKTRSRVSPARLRRLNRAFVASATLKPMTQQLVETRSKAAYAGVEAYARKHAGTDAGGLAWLAVGYVHVLDKEYPQAVVALKKAQPHAGELSDYVRYLLALAYGGQGNNEEVVASLRNFLKQSPESVFARDVVDLYGTALVATGHAQEAVTFLEANRQPTRADVELALGRAYVKAGQPAKGLEALRHLYFTMPASQEADAAAADLHTLETEMAAQPAPYADRKKRATLLEQANRFSDAAREFRTLLPEATEEDRAAMQVRLGICLRRSGNLTEAQQILQGAAATGELDAERLYNLGEIFRSQENDSAFLENLNRMRQETPTSGWFANALLSAGNMQLLEKNYDAAAGYFRELATRFPSNARASYAHWKAAWLDYRQGRFEQAKQGFIEQVEKWPGGLEVPAALYWRGRIAEDEKDAATARVWYAKLADRFRNYYYGYLARERLSQLGDITNTGSDPLLERIPRSRPFPESASETTVPKGDLRVEKSRLLENAGLSDFAVKELLETRESTGPNWATLEIARVYSDAGKYHRALQMLKRAVPSYYSVELDELPRPYWENLFPRPYWTDLKADSHENGLDPHLVASLIRQESEFNPGAISHANAWGLMQLLPKVGRGEAKQLKLRGYVTEQLLSPNVNLKLGTHYLRQMIDHYNGQVEYALAAYNAGTNRVDDWLASGKFRDVPEFVESIPFTETREYVQAIMRNAQVYRRLYPNQ